MVGSNIATTPFSFLPSQPSSSPSPPPEALARNSTILLNTTALLVGLAHLDAIGRAAGTLLVVSLAAYVLWTYRTEQAGTAPQAETDLRAAQATSRPPMEIGLLGDLAVADAGTDLILAGADLLVGSAISMPQTLSVFETVVGLTIVAVGTFQPELAAAWKRQGDVLLGDIVGSNIFNVLWILDITALVAPIPVDLAIA